MRETGRLSVKVLILCIVFNGILLGALFFTATEGFMSQEALLESLPALAPETASEAVATAVAEEAGYLIIQERLLLTGIIGLGSLVTLLLALALILVSRGTLRRVGAGTDVPEGKTTAAPKGRESAPPHSRKAQEKPSPFPAVQILAALQREGRLVDFLQEDLSAYEDMQIGAAVRSVHEGCRKALDELMELRPVYEQESEGTEITVESGFDASAIRLTGNVQGDPPFRGTLQHKGWQITRLELPAKTGEEKQKKWVLCPAEVEVG